MVTKEMLQKLVADGKTLHYLYVCFTYVLHFKPPPPRSKSSLLMNPSLPLKPIANSCFGQKKSILWGKQMEIIQFK